MSTDLAPSTPPDGSLDDACATLAEFFERFACVAKSQAMDSLATTDMTFSQLRVLFAVGAQDCPPSLQQIADTVKLSLASAGRTADGLVKLGLVDRREDLEDRRIKRISLTAAGERLVATQLTIREEVLSGFLGRLPAELRDGLTAALRPIVAGPNDYFAASQ